MAWEQEEYLNDGSLGDSEALRVRLNRLEQGLANLSSPDGLGPLVEAEQSATLTLNRAGGFADEVVFDLGKNIASISLLTTVTSLVGAGETWGRASNGQLVIPIPNVFGSADGVTWSASPITSWLVGSTGDLFAVVGDWAREFAVSGRYVKAETEIDSLGVATPYNGANNPTATLDITLNYV